MFLNPVFCITSYLFIILFSFFFFFFSSRRRHTSLQGDWSSDVCSSDLMYDARLILSRQVAADAREYFGAGVFDTVIPRNVRLAEAPSFGKPIILYDVASVGAQAYVKVAEELMKRVRAGAKTVATAAR